MSRATILPISSIPQVVSRYYSYESAAVRQDAEPEQPPAHLSGLVTQFADLVKLGVDPNLVSAITQGMGYDKMTEVQTLTINPAMKGVDL